MADPQSPDEWLTIADRHQRSATLLLADPSVSNDAISHVGAAVECGLKALLMRKTGMNRWPTFRENRDYHTHDLEALARYAGFDVTADHPVAPAWAVVKEWRRRQSYHPDIMPEVVRDAFYEAAFGAEGVLIWLRRP